MKNSTLSRKSNNDMKKGPGAHTAKPQGDQSGDGADFAFNGQMGNGVNRESNRFAGNQHAGVTNPDQLINHGLNQKNRVGNASDSWVDRDERVGPSVTRDPQKKTIATAAQGRNTVVGGARREYPANPDAINVGSK